MPIPNFRLNDLAFTKFMVHAFKYPYMTVNGFLLGQKSAPGRVDIVDAVPVLHYQSDFTPGWAGEAEVRIDIGFGMVRSSSCFYSHFKLRRAFCEVDCGLRPQSHASYSWIL